MAESRIIVISNRLPVHITEKAGQLVLERSLGGLATALGSVMNTHKMLWIGWPGTPRKLTRGQLLDLKFPDLLVPVAISKRLLTHYYTRIASGVLWPILHGIKPARLDLEADWDATRDVVERFAEAAVQATGDDDVVWIHDYHLVLLPRVLRERGVGNRMGFFLHTPFPPPSVFMAWKHHRPILESLAQVDVLGFQTERDARNFRACLKACGFELRAGAEVRAFPIGVDFQSYRAADKLREVAKFMGRIKPQKALGRRLILSVSRLDYTKGILEQIGAVERVLELYGPSRLRYRLVVAPSRESIEEYQQLRDQIESAVGRVNGRFARAGRPAPIVFEYRSHGFEELNAWYRVADVLLVTPIRDGMNLVVKEYIAARGRDLGAVVLSRTIGAAAQLRDAIQVDPTDVNAIARGLAHAIEMPLVEQGRRWDSLLKNVRQEDVFWWTNTFLAALFGLQAQLPPGPVTSETVRAPGGPLVRGL